MVLYFSNSFSPSIRKYINLLFLSLSPSLTLNVLTNQLALIISKQSRMTLSNYPRKYLEIVFVSTNFVITILSIMYINIPNIYCFFLHHKIFLCYFCLAKFQHYYTFKIIFLANWYKHFSKNIWNSSDFDFY